MTTALAITITESADTNYAYIESYRIRLGDVGEQVLRGDPQVSSGI